MWTGHCVDCIKKIHPSFLVPSCNSNRMFIRPSSNMFEPVNGREHFVGKGRMFLNRKLY